MVLPQATPEQAASASGGGELRTRILSALVLAPVALALAWAGGWFFAALIGAAAIAMAHELGGLLLDGRREAAVLACFAIAAVLLAGSGLPAVALIAGASGLAFAAAARAWRDRPLWPVLAAYPYLILPLVAMIWLRADPQLGLVAIFWLLGVVWATDSFAYFTGRAIGGPKLIPRLSPKKTWAGLLGGMAGAALVGAAVSLWLGMGSAPLLAALSAGLAVLSQAGDFAESALKRRAGVKDSGKLIPGHGGILDRVDGLVAAAMGAGAIALLHAGAAGPGAGVLIWP